MLSTEGWLLQVLTGEEEEDSELHAAQHGQEALPDDEGEQQVDEDVQRLAGAAGVQRVDLPACMAGSVSIQRRGQQSLGWRQHVSVPEACDEPTKGQGAAPTAQHFLLPFTHIT